MPPSRISILDTHTAGEPTRVVLAGGPDLGTGPLAERRTLFRERFDAFRRAVVNEPRGSDVLVGALLVPPTARDCVAGVIFFNNVGTWACAATAPSASASPWATWAASPPAGTCWKRPSASCRSSSTAATPSRSRTCPAIATAPASASRSRASALITGDVAWGGNWFFLVGDHGQALTLDRVESAHRRDAGAFVRPWRDRASPGPTGPRSTTSSCSARPPRRTPTAETSSSAPARPTTARRAAPAPAPSSPAWSPTASSPPASRGRRRASSAADSPAASDIDGRPDHPAHHRHAPSSPPRRPCSSTPRDPFCWGIA